MKKCFYVLAAGLLAFAACSKDEDPAVSFSAAVPVETDGVATFSITSDYDGTEAVEIPVTFSGTAVKGTDYTVSSEKFVLGGTSPVTTITVTPLVYGSKKDIVATLVPPAGFKAGQYVSSAWTVSELVGYVSFDSKKALLAGSTSIKLSIYDEQGNFKSLTSADEFTVSVDPASTAVEGTHFKFTNGNTITVGQGESTGSLQIEFLGDAPEEGHDQIVLDLVSGARYGMGQYDQVTVNIAGSAFDVFSGKWVISEIIDDKESVMDSWYEPESGMTGFPEFDAADAFTLDFENAAFIPAFNSKFKNYFIGESSITPAGEYTISGLDMTRRKINVQLLLLDNVNRYFSDSESSEDKEGYIGLAMSEDQTTLRLFVLDHESTSFLINSEADMKEWGMSIYDSTKPTATTGGVCIEVNFTKSE